MGLESDILQRSCVELSWRNEYIILPEVGTIYMHYDELSFPHNGL